MPQGPLSAAVATNPSNSYAPMHVDAFGQLRTATSVSSHLDVTATTVIKTAPGRVVTLTIVAAPTGAGGVYDSAVTSGLGASNQIMALGTSTTGPIYTLDWPCANGITINPGGGTIAVAYV